MFDAQQERDEYRHLAEKLYEVLVSISNERLDLLGEGLQGEINDACVAYEESAVVRAAHNLV